MGLLDDYLNSSSETPAVETKPSAGGLLEQYLNSPSSETKPKSSAPVRPPISGVSKEASDEINAQPVKAGGENPREQELIQGIRNLPNNVGNAIIKDAKEGLSTFSEGVSDTFSGKPATGIGKVGLGILSTLVSPVSGTSKEVIAKPVTELTGNKKAGDIAEIALTGGLPVAKATKATIAAIPKNKALKTLVESIGPENAGAVAKAMRENPRLSPADLSPKVKQDVQHLFVTDGPQINYLSDQVAKRSGTAKEAVEGIIDAGAGGAAVNAAEKMDKLKANIKAVGSTEINPTVVNAKPVDLTKTIKNIDDTLKPGVMSKISNETDLALPEVEKALTSVRKYLTDDKSMRTNAEDLNKVQSMLRRTGEKLIQSTDGGARSQGDAILKVRNDIVDAIDIASGGKYKPALAKYRDENHIQDAFEHGYESILKNSKSLQDRPEFFEKWVKNATDAEKEAAREGARLAFDTQINGFKHGARRGTDIGEVEFNKQRIEALFDKKEANKMFADLKHERAIADTDNKIVHGSQTAMRLASKAAFEMPTKGDVGKNLLPAAIVEGASILGSGTPGAGTAIYGGLKVLTAGKDYIAAKLAKEHQLRYAKYAMPEGANREELIQALEAVAAKPPKQSIVRRAANAGVRLGSLVAP